MSLSVKNTDDYYLFGSNLKDSISYPVLLYSDDNVVSRLVFYRIAPSFYPLKISLNFLICFISGLALLKTADNSYSL